MMATIPHALTSSRRNKSGETTDDEQTTMPGQEGKERADGADKICTLRANLECRSRQLSCTHFLISFLISFSQLFVSLFYNL
jgi:hypothetical protein